MDAGDQEGLRNARPVEELAVEVPGRPDDERGVLCPLREPEGQSPVHSARRDQGKAGDVRAAADSLRRLPPMQSRQALLERELLRLPSPDFSMKQEPQVDCGVVFLFT